jgi:hypothetical protein
MIDYQEIYGLLHVADLSMKWPNLRALHDMALAELADAAAEAQKELDARAKALAEEQAKADLKAQQEAQKKRDAEEAEAKKAAETIKTRPPVVLPLNEPTPPPKFLTEPERRA